MKKNILIVVIAVVLAISALSVGIIIGKSSGASDNSSNGTDYSVWNTNPSSSELASSSDPDSPFAGNIIVMVNSYRGYLLTSDNADDLRDIIDPSLSKDNKLFCDYYDDGKHYYEPNLDVTFIYKEYDADDFIGFELGYGGAKIYDFSSRDFSEDANLSTSGMQSTGEYKCDYGKFTFFQ